MIAWKTPTLEDGPAVRALVGQQQAKVSDCSFANIYLLRNKYQTEIAFHNGFLLRCYHGNGSRCGYTFPLGKGDPAPILEALAEDAALRGESLRFILLTEEQKAALKHAMPHRFSYSTNPGDSDYLYTAAALADLPGKILNKKRNRVTHFNRLYPDNRYEPLREKNCPDALAVARRWVEESAADDRSITLEYEAIREALDHWQALELFGGVLYVNDTPVAMTVASAVSGDTVDVHFEKAVGEFAANGAYAAVNRCFAQSAAARVEWINREEDINIEGLRRAKLSYRPAALLTKYSAQLKG